MSRGSRFALFTCDAATARRCLSTSLDLRLPKYSLVLLGKQRHDSLREQGWPPRNSLCRCSFGSEDRGCRRRISRHGPSSWSPAEAASLLSESGLVSTDPLHRTFATDSPSRRVPLARLGHTTYCSPCKLSRSAPDQEGARGSLCKARSPQTDELSIPFARHSPSLHLEAASDVRRPLRASPRFPCCRASHRSG